MAANWVDKVQAYQRNQLRSLDNQPGISMAMPKRTPGWVFLKEEISCIPDALYPWDPGVVKAIREVAPDISPIWIKRIFRTPYTDSRNEVVQFGRHGLGLVARKSHIIPFSCSMPSASSFLKPNTIYWYPLGEADKRARDLPGAYVPFDWRFYKHVKNNYRYWSTDELKAFIMSKYEAHEKGLEKQRIEAEHANKYLQSYGTKKLEQVSEVELKEHFLGKIEKAKNGQVASPSNQE